MSTVTMSSLEAKIAAVKDERREATATSLRLSKEHAEAAQKVKALRKEGGDLKTTAAERSNARPLRDLDEVKVGDIIRYQVSDGWYGSNTVFLLVDKITDSSICGDKVDFTETGIKREFSWGSRGGNSRGRLAKGGKRKPVFLTATREGLDQARRERSDLIDAISKVSDLRESMQKSHQREAKLSSRLRSLTVARDNAVLVAQSRAYEALARAHREEYDELMEKFLAESLEDIEEGDE